MSHVGHMLISSFKNIVLMLHSLIQILVSAEVVHLTRMGLNRMGLTRVGIEPATNILLMSNRPKQVNTLAFCIGSSDARGGGK